MKVQFNIGPALITLENEEVNQLCKPGSEDTCVWLVASVDGFQCLAKARPHHLIERFNAGKTNAKRDGCKFLNDLQTLTLEMRANTVKYNGVNNGTEEKKNTK